MKPETDKKTEKFVRVTAWVPQKKLKTLMKGEGKKYSQSEVLRMLIDNELERLQSNEAHQGLYGIAKSGDFDDRLL